MHFAKKFGHFCFSTLDTFLGFFGFLGRPLVELFQPQNFAWWVGRCSVPALSRKRRGKRFRFRLAHPSNTSDDEHEEDDKDDEDHKD